VTTLPMLCPSRDREHVMMQTGALAGMLLAPASSSQDQVGDLLRVGDQGKVTCLQLHGSPASRSGRVRMSGPRNARRSARRHAPCESLASCHARTGVDLLSRRELHFEFDVYVLRWNSFAVSLPRDGRSSHLRTKAESWAIGVQNFRPPDDLPMLGQFTEDCEQWLKRNSKKLYRYNGSASRWLEDRRNRRKGRPRGVTTAPAAAVITI
jgi:hypothetical protein